MQDTTYLASYSTGSSRIAGVFEVGELGAGEGCGIHEARGRAGGANVTRHETLITHYLPHIEIQHICFT